MHLLGRCRHEAHAPCVVDNQMYILYPSQCDTLGVALRTVLMVLMQV
jgi:hypothetical protein